MQEVWGGRYVVVWSTQTVIDMYAIGEAMRKHVGTL